MILNCSLCKHELPDTNTWKETNLSSGLLWATCVCGWVNYHIVKQEGMSPMKVGKT